MDKFKLALPPGITVHGKPYLTMGYADPISDHQPVKFFHIHDGTAVYEPKPSKDKYGRGGHIKPGEPFKLTISDSWFKSDSIFDMGIHISVLKLGEFHSDKYDHYYDEEKHPGWDTVRRGGDHDFHDDVKFERIAYDGGQRRPSYEHDYYRPEDFNVTRAYLLRQPDNVRDRFMPIIDEMEKDKSLVFRFSY